MTYPPRPGRPSARVARSQFALRLGLAVYAALCAAVALRCTVRLLGLPDSVTSVGAIIAATDPLVAPLTFLPAANRILVGSAALADFTALIILLAAPLPLLGRQPRVRG